jgi:hypothetical protein
MKQHYQYQVWPERRMLIRLSSECTELFCPCKDVEWQRAPHLDAIRYGGGDFVWYQSISEAEAMQYMDAFREAAKASGE